jgi:hypothetical protein
MDIINKEFPVGKKFYSITNQDLGVRLIPQIESLLNIKTFNALKVLQDTAVPSNDTFNLRISFSWLKSLELLNSSEYEEYPKFIINSSHMFLAFSSMFNINTVHKKSAYQAITRIPAINNMPYFKGMIVQWDSNRKGFIVHNTPYEGELDVVKKSVVSKYITKVLNDLVDENGIFEILGESLYMSYSTSSSVHSDTVFKETFLKFLAGTHTAEDVKHIAVNSGAYYMSHDHTERQRLRNIGNPSSKFNKLVRTGNKPKISTVTRQILLYTYGGLKLPDNYKAWFDG